MITLIEDRVLNVISQGALGLGSAGAMQMSLKNVGAYKLSGILSQVDFARIRVFRAQSADFHVWLFNAKDRLRWWNAGATVNQTTVTPASASTSMQMG